MITVRSVAPSLSETHAAGWVFSHPRRRTTATKFFPDRAIAEISAPHGTRELDYRAAGSSRLEVLPGADQRATRSGTATDALKPPPAAVPSLTGEIPGAIALRHSVKSQLRATVRPDPIRVDVTVTVRERTEASTQPLNGTTPVNRLLRHQSESDGNRTAPG